MMKALNEYNEPVQLPEDAYDEVILYVIFMVIVFIILII